MMPDRSIEGAQALQRQGRRADAEALYRELLREQPDSVGALEGLGVLLLQQGRAHDAAPLFARAVALRPESARLRASLGEILRTLGRLDEALGHLRKAVGIDPTLAHAWYGLGRLASDQGRYAAAEVAFREAIRHRPGFAPAFIDLGQALRALGRGRDAAEAQRSALRIEPNNLSALINLANVLGELADPGCWKEAEAVSRRALVLAPHFAPAIKSLGAALRRQGRLEDALAIERPARTAEPGSAEAHFERGVAHLRDGRHDDSEAAFRAALSVDPTMATAWVGLSQIQSERGEIEPSCESARAALARDPRLAEAHWRLATTLRGRLPDTEVRAIEDLVRDESVPNGSAAFLRFGLGSVLDDRGLYAQAAEQIEKANALQCEVMSALGRSHDPEADALFIDRMIAVCDAELLARGRDRVERDPRPVFVVGLQRSGTTLVEQILASHPKIHGAGELRDVARIFQSLPDLAGLDAGDSFDALRCLGPASARAAARIYLDRLDALAPPEAARVVDKMPDNIRLLGLIALLWPGARVIVCSRDLRDVAVSCWLNGFAMIWTKKWDHIARRFADYQRIVEHWRRTQAVAWLEVRYEELVGDLEGQARRLIDYVDLGWDPACLAFHATRRVVKTPSLVQVRQPIHANSVGRWKNYEPSLRPLFEAFRRHGVQVE